MSVPVLDKAGPLLASYDVLFCDVWGVIHDGATAFEEAGEALARFRKGGGTVILVSNAPVPNQAVAGVLAEKRVRRDAWDAIVSSGDLTLAHVAEKRYRKTYRIGPARDSGLFRLLPGQATDLEEAQAIICTGLINDGTETAAHYAPILHRALALKLPLVCANPDLVVDVAGTRYLCAGSIAEVYEKLGGLVHWAGKPHAPAYDTALATASRLREETVSRSRILAIGDAVRTDIEGAHRAGIASVFIAAGIHKREVTRDGRIVPERLDALFAGTAALPLAAMTGLR